MKRLLIFICIISGVLSAGAQKVDLPQEITTGDIIHYASDKTIKKFVGPPEKTVLKSAGTVKTVFNVNAVNLTDEAKTALNYAVSIWEELVFCTVPIDVTVKMEPFAANIVAKSKPASFFMNFDGALYKNVYYPVALSEKLSGEEKNMRNPDIICSLNQNLPWYYGTDGNTPETHYDFVTAILHEIAHGLGFSGFFKDDGTKGFLNNGNNLPSIYDLFVYNNQDQQLANSVVFPSPSVQLHDALISGSLRFLTSKTNEKTARIAEVYSPPYWNDGASVYHLNDDLGLMMPFAAKGLAVHNPGMEVLEVLDEMGWNAPAFDFEPQKDFENPCAGLPVKIGIYSGISFSDFTVQIISSADNFVTSIATELKQSDAADSFQGIIPLDNYIGKIDYYFVVKTTSGKSYQFPSLAPAKTFHFKIGPDYIPPAVAHNPQKIHSVNSDGLKIHALATDNLGIKSVKVEYKLNGELQPAVELRLTEMEHYSGLLRVEKGELEYRIIAEDNSANGNKKFLPSVGFFPVSSFYPHEPVESYSSDFELGMSDFTTADFNVSRIPGFSDNVLHTLNPYPVSALKNEKYNLIAQLKYPVILQNGGEMSFDEVVLVEPGEEGTDCTEDLFWDYVIIEGSKDNGFTWIPFTPGYDSGETENWLEAFTGSLVNNKSQAAGSQNMFRKKMIYLTETKSFSEGDTVLFRFRLASDYSLNGWGWAIDNLEIQTSLATDSDLIVQKSIHAFPNPFDGRFFLDFSEIESTDQINVTVTDIFGKTIYKKDELSAYSSRESIELYNAKSGIYLLKVTGGNKILYDQKMIKK